MSKSTSEAFADVIEWAAEQPWSNGKVGLAGISYFAVSQWRVAARQPKGLAAIIPVDGMADYYRDRCPHGGILTGFFTLAVVLTLLTFLGEAVRDAFDPRRQIDRSSTPELP